MKTMTLTVLKILFSLFVGLLRTCSFGFGKHLGYFNHFGLVELVDYCQYIMATNPNYRIIHSEVDSDGQASI